MPEPNAVLHTTPITVRWGDMDTMGHVNNAAYLRYYEQARIDWWMEMGIGMAGTGEGPILARATVNFLKPITYPCEIDVTVTAGKVGGASFTIGGEIVDRADSSQRYADAEFVIVWLDYDSGKTLRVPDSLRSLFP
jgi:acyl-CoA thioester hydrolase